MAVCRGCFLGLPDIFGAESQSNAQGAVQDGTIKHPHGITKEKMPFGMEKTRKY